MLVPAAVTFLFRLNYVPATKPILVLHDYSKYDLNEILVLWDSKYVGAQFIMSYGIVEIVSVESPVYVPATAHFHVLT